MMIESTELESIRVLRIAPNDILIFKLGKAAPASVIETITETVKSKLRENGFDNGVFVMDSTVTLQILAKGPSPE